MTESDDPVDWPTYGFSFGRRLRLIRRFRRLTQEQLAHRSGMHRNQVGNLERNAGGGGGRDEGPADPHLSTVYRLARVLRVPPELLLPDAADTVSFRSRETADGIAWAQVESDMRRRLVAELQAGSSQREGGGLPPIVQGGRGAVGFAPQDSTAGGQSAGGASVDTGDARGAHEEE